MKRQVLSILIAISALLSNQVAGGDHSPDIDLINKSIELTEKTAQQTQMDTQSAQKILEYLTSSNKRWKHFLGQIRQGDKGAIVTALHLIEFSRGETQEELHFAVQETLIEIPNVVLEANVTANVTQDWVCGKPAYENYDLATHLNSERIATLEMMLTIMGSPDKKKRTLYDQKLRGAAESCLELLRNLVKDKGYVPNESDRLINKIP